MKLETKLIWSGCVQQIPRYRMIQIMLESLNEREKK